jgi:thiol-disulfide isomerase/thioredoxin
LTAAAVGAGVAFWHFGDGQPAGLVLPEDVWSFQWDSPQGGKVSLASFRGKPLLLNFWATWCPPCVEELPLINDFYRKNLINGWQVLGLAIDKPSAVQSFLRQIPLDFPVGMAGLTGSELAKNLGNLSESLPFSVVIGSNGSVIQRKLGRLSPGDLELWARLK